MRPIKRKTRRANAILEAAFVLPILLLLAFGTVEFGHFFYVKHNLQGAARQGARAAIPASATNATVTTAVTEAMTLAGLQSSGYAVTTNPANVAAATDGTNVSVTVQCTWGAVGLRPLSLIAANKPVRSTAVMRKEAN
jgi:Flp pilus assembly protein TadG